MAHKKGGGSSRNGRDSKSKRLGVKKFGGEYVSAGISWFANAAPRCIPAGMLVWAKITPFLQPRMVLSILRRCRVDAKRCMSLPSRGRISTVLY
jgi:hypothetical protein